LLILGLPLRAIDTAVGETLTIFAMSLMVGLEVIIVLTLQFSTEQEMICQDQFSVTNRNKEKYACAH
jgi:hypothetical protein